MTLVINGDQREVQARDIAELVGELGMPLGAALVEHNGTALRRDEWAERRLCDGDRIEVVRVVAGG